MTGCQSLVQVHRMVAASEEHNRQPHQRRLCANQSQQLDTRAVGQCVVDNGSRVITGAEHSQGVRGGGSAVHDERRCSEGELDRLTHRPRIINNQDLLAHGERLDVRSFIGGCATPIAPADWPSHGGRKCKTATGREILT